MSDPWSQDPQPQQYLQPQQYPQQQYPQQSVPPNAVAYYSLPPQPRQPTEGFAVAAMVLGIVWLFWVGSALAIIFGHIALKKIAREGTGGKGMAVAGLVLGYIGAGTFTLLVVLNIIGAIAASSPSGG